jgi:hypothetical protein
MPYICYARQPQRCKGAQGQNASASRSVGRKALTRLPCDLLYREVTMVEVKEVLRLWRAGLLKKPVAVDN